MISRELLNAVLGDKYNVERLCEWYEIEDGYLKTHYDCGNYDLQGRPTGLGIEINIHELVHLCKEWVLSKGYYFEIHIKLSETHIKLWQDTSITKLFKSFKMSTEPEAIFKAAQWILDNVKTNSLP